jgi:hypothetical protein
MADESIQLLTLRSEIAQKTRALLAEPINLGVEIRLPDVTDEILALLTQDEDFERRLLTEFTRAAVYSVVQSVVQQPRSIGYLYRQRAALAPQQRRTASLADRMQHWYERVGDRHIPVLDMTRADLDEAIAERRRTADFQNYVAGVWETVRDQLGPTDRIGDKFSKEALAALALELAGQPDNGTEGGAIEAPIE